MAVLVEMWLKRKGKTERRFHSLIALNALPSKGNVIDVRVDGEGLRVKVTRVVKGAPGMGHAGRLEVDEE